jgi:nitroreductase
MDTLTAIKERRSVKYFDPNYQMTEAEINTLLEHTILSPTSFNIQNWRFVVVKDKEIKEKLKAASWGQSQVSDASIVVLLCGDLNAWAKEPERYWKDTPAEVQNQIVPMIGKFYQDNPQLQRDEAMRSCGMAGQTIMLAAKAMGYDTCPMIGFNLQQVAEIINLPENHVICFMIVVGKALEPARSRAGQLDLNEVMVIDTF